MAKFIYKLENILTIKYKLEDQAKNVFGKAQAKVETEEQKLSNLMDRRAGYEHQLCKLMTDRLNLQEITRCQDAVEILKYDIRIQTIAVRSARQELELARAKLKEAMVERKTHEKMKEKAFEAFKVEVALEERKEVDELTSFKYGSNQESEH